MDLPAAFDIRAIRIFLTVADAGGMTAAGRRLGLTQSSVSQAIATLEEAAGVALFDRNQRPIGLTPAGAVLRDRGAALIAAASDAFLAVAGGTGRPASLTLAMAESVANTVGPALVSRMAHAADRWRIWSGISPDHQAALLSHQVDMIVSASGELDGVEGLEHHALVTEPFVLVFARDQAPDDAGEAVDLARLAARPFVRYSQRSAIGRQIERQLTRLGLELPFHAEFDTATGQLAAVAAGMGWSLTTPLCLAQEAARLDALHIAPMPRGRFSRTMSLLARRGEHGTLTAAVADTIRAILSADVLGPLLARYPFLGPALLVAPASSPEGAVERDLHASVTARRESA
ncbi:LysR family transcriptional regulator [Acuticoccus mangrovi]|uniref:LysR family transcriptional regulator n=1 Tax=Acuticoccus mangrovi TaxID=2796142 RepID=A0A934ILR6_9HYPH|nr:LysR family transcriptional regulator [Acuticoccus mangrovi]MBJ3774668.1 LysR family transcriptional regulator [Acuticoccus mangrovi]